MRLFTALVFHLLCLPCLAADYEGDDSEPAGTARAADEVLSDADQQFLQKVKTVVERQIEEGHVSVDAMAQEFCMSITTFRRRFTAVAGDKMWAFLDGCYAFTPANTTDYVVWTSGNESVVNVPPIGIGGTGRLEPVDVGDAVLTGEVYTYNNVKRTDIAPITVTVHVVMPVVSISTPFTDGTDPRKPTLDCSLGDNLTPYLVDGQAFTVQPANATNKAVTIALGDYGESVLAIDANGRVTAVGDGDAKLVVTSVDNPAISTTIIVKVHNDYRTISVKKAEIGILVTDGEKDITTEIVDNVTYDTGNGDPITMTTDPQELPYRLDINGGWEWRTVPYGNFGDLNLLDVFGTDLVEIRTQGEQVYNDPQYGLFGDLNLMDQNVCFKMKTGEERPEVSSAYLYGGSLGQIEPVTLRRGWNWIPNPYVFRRQLSDCLAGSFVEGDRLVSKDGGFTEYSDNRWTGNLYTLDPGQGYLFYNAGEAGRTLAFNDEFEMDAQDYYATARMAARSLFTYDASRFRDNMTIVAQLEGVGNADDYQTYAFVGDECRGEGMAVGGRQFITVHANAGEKIAFKLYNTATGQLFDGDQTVTMQTMLGTVKAPFLMSSQAAATGIEDIDDSRIDNSRMVFDLSGRSTKTLRQGVQIVRRQDGTVHKIIKK